MKSASSTIVPRRPGFFLPLWTLISAAANLVWEFAQLPLYTLSDDPDTGKIVRYVLHCTAGDVLIALGVYALTALALRNWSWPARNPLRGILLVTTLGLAYTAVSEWHNVYGAAEWAYGENMPLVFGIGLAPLLQWLLIPPLVLLIVRWAGKKTMQHGHPDGGAREQFEVFHLQQWQTIVTRIYFPSTAKEM